jgi:hypothetical protein
VIDLEEMMRPEDISTIAIGVPRRNEGEPIYDRLITVSLLHVMQVEPLEAAPSASAD